MSICKYKMMIYNFILNRARVSTKRIVYEQETNINSLERGGGFVHEEEIFLRDFFSHSEADVSELLEHFDEMFPLYYSYCTILVLYSYCTVLYSYCTVRVLYCTNLQ